ncbi:hypothetical protein NFJ02_28g65390 [Pycnococcus provasolii]
MSFLADLHLKKAQRSSALSLKASGVASPLDEPSSSSSSKKRQKQESQQQRESEEEMETVRIKVHDTRFQPREVDIPAGGTLEMQALGDQRHRVEVLDEFGDVIARSPPLVPGTPWKLKLKRPGAYQISTEIYTFMTCVAFVIDNDPPSPTRRPKSKGKHDAQSTSLLPRIDLHGVANTTRLPGLVDVKGNRERGDMKRKVAKEEARRRLQEARKALYFHGSANGFVTERAPRAGAVQALPVRGAVTDRRPSKRVDMQDAMERIRKRFEPRGGAPLDAPPAIPNMPRASQRRGLLPSIAAR